MKLEFHGHDERYTVEQSLLNLFPGELPVYEPIRPEDENWATVSWREDEKRGHACVELCRQGKTVAFSRGLPLEGCTPYGGTPSARPSSWPIRRSPAGSPPGACSPACGPTSWRRRP